MRKLPSSRLLLGALTLGSFCVAVAIAGCSSDPGSTLGGGGYHGGPGGGGATGDGGFPVGPDGNVVVPTCSIADLTAQTACGAGFGCDVDRSPVVVTQDAGGGGGGDAASDASAEGGGGGDGGGGGGGGGGTGQGPYGGGVVCRKATAAGTEGAACNASDPSSCAAGLTCGVLADGTPASSAVCRKFCANGDSGCTSPGGACMQHQHLTNGGTTFEAPTCTLSCDPITAQGCAAGEGCTVSIKNDRSRLFTDCVHAGAGDHLAPCTTGGDCKAGFACLKISTQPNRVCLQTCTRKPTLGTCAAGRTCMAVSAPNTLGGTEYGWCY